MRMLLIGDGKGDSDEGGTEVARLFYTFEGLERILS
jgi:hypothetical protein